MNDVINEQVLEMVRDRQVELSSVGQAAPGIELKIADNGEVLVKGVSVLKEYYKRPDLSLIHI